MESALNLASLHLGPADMGSADGIIRVSAWETAHGRAPRDCGLALLAAADAAVRAAGYRHGGFLLDLAPRQFDGLAHRDRMRRLDYRAARTRLEDHLIRGIERTSWQGSGFVVYEPEPGPEGATTVTADDEPRPMADDEYPEGFGLDRIVYLPGCRWVAPHARFWSAMPSELRSVSVEYREGRLEQGGPLETWDHLIDFAFAYNPLQVPEPDTTLDLDSREIGGLGVHFVRRMADAVSYARTVHRGREANELRIVQRFQS